MSSLSLVAGFFVVLWCTWVLWSAVALLKAMLGDKP